MKQLNRADYILYFVSLFLPFLHFLTVFPIMNLYLPFFVAGIICSVVYVELKKRYFLRKLPFFIILIIFLFFLLNISWVKTSIFYIYNQITTVYAQTSTYTFEQFPIPANTGVETGVFFLLVSIFLLEMIILYHCIFEESHLFTVFLCTFLFFFPSLLYSPPIPWILTIGLFILWGYLLFISFYKKRQKTSDTKAELRIFLYIASCIVVVCVSLFTLLPPQYYQISSIKSGLRANLVDVLYRSSYSLLNGKEKEGEVDLNLAGNRHYTGAVQFTVEREKSEALYLKTLSSAFYNDNAWTVLTQESYAQGMNIKWNQIRTWMNVYTNQIQQEDDEKIIIHDTRKNRQYALEPYNLSSIQQESGIYYDAYMTLPKEKKDYTYEVWDVASLTDNSYFNSEEGNAYIDFVYDHYLQIPSELEEVFDNTLYLEHFQTPLECINYVKAYLSKNYSYTLSPGYPPKNQDFITWFLTQSHRGYCVHFASAATMMLRYYGIPARYVEGYRIDAYTPDYKGTARDSDAHAWVEIFTRDKGCIPVEVTPGFRNADEDYTVPSTIEDPSTQPNTDVQNTPNEDPQREQNNTQNENFQTLINEQGNRNTNTQTTLNIHIPKYVYIMISIFGVLVLVYGQRKIRYHRKKKKMMNSDRKQAVIALMQYYEALCRFGAQEQEEIHSLYEKAIYSRQGLDEREFHQLTSFIQEEKNKLMHRMKKRAKLKLRYIKALD